MAGIETSISSAPMSPPPSPVAAEQVQVLAEEPPAPPSEVPDTQPPSTPPAAQQEQEEEQEEYDEYDAHGCHCDECLNYESEQDDYYDDRYDGGGGLDWNESGYFD